MQLEPILLPVFDRRDLTRLPDHEAYIRIRTSAAFGELVFNIYSPLRSQPANPDLAHSIRCTSRQKYSRPRAEVEARIRARTALFRVDDAKHCARCGPDRSSVADKASHVNPSGMRRLASVNLLRHDVRTR